MSETEEKNVKSGQRIRWIDVAKGICMISVIAGHMGVRSISNVVFSYHLTVFFILSGYTLKDNLSLEQVNKRFRSLMIPYFVTCAAVTTMDVFNQIFLTGNRDLLVMTQIIGRDLTRSFMASGSITRFGSMDVGGRIGAVWFLPATFFAVVFAQVLLKYVDMPKRRYAIALPLALLSCVSAQYIWLPFSIQAAFLAMPLILLGYDLRENGLLSRLRAKHIFACLAVFGIGIWMKKTPVYYVTASMADYVISSVCAVASSLFILYIARMLSTRLSCRILTWIGRNSIYYLCIHLFEMETMGRWFDRCLNSMGLPINAWTLFGIKILFITAATALILAGKKCLQKGKTSLQSPRDPALDIAKGALIILMLLGHMTIDQRLRDIVYSFHMAAFIFYSGYCFREGSAQNLTRTILKEIRRFLVPYALFGMGYVLLTHQGLMKEIRQIVFGMSFSRKLFTDVPSIGPVYFILLLFVTKVIYLFVDRFSSGEGMKALCVLGLSLLGQYLGKQGYWLPWSADCALYGLIFYYLGRCAKRYGVMEYVCERPYFYFFLSSLWVFMISSGSMELAIRQYGAYGTVVLGATSASILLYMLCRYICGVWNEQLVHLLCAIGKSTLYVLIVHKLFGGYIAKCLSLAFMEGSIFYAAMMICIQLILGLTIGACVMRLQKFYRVTVKRA